MAALGASEVPADKLINCVRRLDGRGFASKPFRTESARCLREVARRTLGLDEGICELLEGWIVERSSGTDEDVADSDETVRTAGKSILWSGQSMVVLPHGNYPVLDALMLGHLLREPPDLIGCFAVLGRHLKRDEDAKVWSALAGHMPFLVHADHQRGIEFLNNLFARCPTFLNTKSGVMLVARVVDRIPQGMIRSILNGWVCGRLGTRTAGRWRDRRLEAVPPA